jgi:hypothetical protein
MGWLMLLQEMWIVNWLIEEFCANNWLAAGQVTCGRWSPVSCCCMESEGPSSIEGPSRPAAAAADLLTGASVPDVNTVRSSASLSPALMCAQGCREVFGVCQGCHGDGHHPNCWYRAVDCVCATEQDWSSSSSSLCSGAVGRWISERLGVADLAVTGGCCSSRELPCVVIGDHHAVVTMVDRADGQRGPRPWVRLCQ